MKFSKILCLVRGNDTDDPVVETAVNLLLPRRRMLYLVYVIRAPRTQRIDEYLEEDVTRAEAALNRAQSIAETNSEDVHTVIIQGRSAGAIILREVVERRISAVVLSVDPASDLGGFNLDLDVQYLLEKSPSAVITVRKPSPTWIDESETLATIDSGATAGRVG